MTNIQHDPEPLAKPRIPRRKRDEMPAGKSKSAEDLPPWIYAFYFNKLLPTAYSIYGGFKDPFVAFVPRTPKNVNTPKPLGLTDILTQLVRNFSTPPCNHVVEESDLLFVCVSVSLALGLF